MDFSTKEYLPNSEKRIENLRKIINGRPVAILAAGPSIKELEEKIIELRDADICYFGLNKFFVQEKYILSKINKRFSVTSCSGREGLPEAMSSIIDFLNRHDNNMFISSFWRDAFGLLNKDFNFNQFINGYNNKLLFFSISKARIVPNKGKPLHFIHSNSLLVLIQFAIIGGASKIVLFGADGYVDNKNEYYYRHNEYAAVEWEGAHQSLINDTEYYFNPIAKRAVKNAYKTYKLSPVDILNCSEKSNYTPFPIISYENTFDLLKKNKEYSRGMDLRISKIHLAINLLIKWFSFNLILFYLNKYRWAIIKIGLKKIYAKLVKNYYNIFGWRFNAR